MMKRWVLAVVLLALVALAGCGAGIAGEPGLKLGEIPWKDGDKVVYDIMGKDGKLGMVRFEFTRDQSAWILKESDNLVHLEQKTTLRIDAKTLKPLGGQKLINASDTGTTVVTSYGVGKLDIRTDVNGQSESTAIDVPANILDNDQVLMTLRALPFAEGLEIRFVDVIGARAFQTGTTARVLNRETVTVPAGTFEAWRVELDFGQAQQQAWYDVRAPHHLIQYDNGDARFLLTSLKPQSGK